MLVLPIEGCNLVFGIQWLIILGDIMWNFRKLKMEFTIMGHKVSLRGIQPTNVKLVQQDGIDKFLAKLDEHCMLSVGLYKEEAQEVEGASLLITSVDEGDEGQINADMVCILQEYNNLFETPKYLPPPRLHDHKIILYEGTSTINIRPYRYPTVKKHEIEIMINDIL